MMSEELRVVIRPYAESDIPFIMDSWTISFMQHVFAKAMSNKAKNDQYIGEQVRGFRPLIRALIASILYRAGALIACDADDYDHIIGYIIAEYISGVPVVHWVHVKHWARNNGIAKLMFAAINPNYERQQTIITFDTNQLRKCGVIEKYPLKYDNNNLERVLRLKCKPIVEDPTETPEGA